jgi:hypothetical protein
MDKAMQHTQHTTGDKHSHDDAQAHDAAPAGLHASDHGYELELASKALPAGGGELRFAIRAPDGKLLQDFARVHERELHLFVVSRDLNDYAHLHPIGDGQGVWTVSLPSLRPGNYRLYADFKPKGGPALTLGHQASVPGKDRPPETAVPARKAQIDGFELALDGTLEAGSAQKLTVRVSRDGAPAELEPYLGANAHLVAIRAADGAFLHVHPLHEASASGEVAFSAELPSAGRYRLFVDFKVRGIVRTGAFTVDVSERS